MLLAWTSSVITLRGHLPRFDPGWQEQRFGPQVPAYVPDRLKLVLLGLAMLKINACHRRFSLRRLAEDCARLLLLLLLVLLLLYYYCYYYCYYYYYYCYYYYYNININNVNSINNNNYYYYHHYHYD